MGNPKLLNRNRRTDFDKFICTPYRMHIEVTSLSCLTDTLHVVRTWSSEHWEEGRPRHVSSWWAQWANWRCEAFSWDGHCVMNGGTALCAREWRGARGLEVPNEPAWVTVTKHHGLVGMVGGLNQWLLCLLSALEAANSKVKVLADRWPLSLSL